MHARAGFQVWCLSERGLSCDQRGLRLAGATLIERQGDNYSIRPAHELARLLEAAYDVKCDPAPILPGLATVARALSAGNYCLARIAAVQLRLPEVPDALARVALQIENITLRLERQQEDLTRYAGQPRAGGPPNAGWFASEDDSSSSGQIAQDEEPRAEESESSDSMAAFRQAQWNAKIAQLRAIDPKNPALSYIANPRSLTSQAALDRLNDALRQATSQRVLDRVMPYGKPIGQEGSDPATREVRGGLDAAKHLFDYLSVGGTTDARKAGTTVTRLPGDTGYITFRPKSNSGPPAVEVNLRNGTYLKIHYP